MTCLSQALMPLMVILQEAMCNTGISESVMWDALKGEEVIKEGGTLDRGEEKPE